MADISWQCLLPANKAELLILLITARGPGGHFESRCCFISKGGSVLPVEKKGGDQAARTGTEDILWWVMLSNATGSLGWHLFKAGRGTPDER